MKKKANIILVGVIVLFFICLTVIIYDASSIVKKFFNGTPTSESVISGE